eukprot:tig00000190_g13839.t1
MGRNPKLGGDEKKYSQWAMSFKKKQTIQQDTAIEKHLSVTTLSSEGQIIRYDTDRAFAWYGCFLIIKGTIVQWTFVLKALLLCAFATGLGFIRCPGEDTKDYHIGERWGWCLPPTFLMDSSLLSFSSLVAFLLGAFISNCFKRWWDCRTYVQKIMSLTNEMAMLSVAYIKSPKPEEAELVQKVREELVRYLNAAHALVRPPPSPEPEPKTKPEPRRPRPRAPLPSSPHARKRPKRAPEQRHPRPRALAPPSPLSIPSPARKEPKPPPRPAPRPAPPLQSMPARRLAFEARPSTRRALLIVRPRPARAGLITAKEREILAHSSYKTHVVYSWASDLLTRAMERGLVFNVGGSTGMRIMQENICRMRSSASDIFMYLDTQIPYGYVYLMTMLTRIHLLLMTVYAGGIIAKGFDNKYIYKLLFGYAWLTFNIFIYEGILQFAHELENPFGYDRQDFPVILYKQKLAKTSHELISNDSSPVQWLHGTCSPDAHPAQEPRKTMEEADEDPTEPQPAVKMVKMESSAPAPPSESREATHVPAAGVASP